jgi:hypothetical protein
MQNCIITYTFHCEWRAQQKAIYIYIEHNPAAAHAAAAALSAFQPL